MKWLFFKSVKRLIINKYWSFSFSISPSNEYSELISLMMDWLDLLAVQGSLRWAGWISLQSKGLSRVFSNTAVQKHEFFSAQPSLWSSSHIHTWLLEWVSIFSSRVSSQSRDQSRVSCVSWIGRCILYYWASWEALRLRNSPIIRELSDPHHPPPGRWINQRPMM